jgi:hypothetical protein
MDPDGTRNQEILSWRGPAAIFLAHRPTKQVTNIWNTPLPSMGWLGAEHSHVMANVVATTVTLSYLFASHGLGHGSPISNVNPEAGKSSCSCTNNSCIPSALVQFFHEVKAQQEQQSSNYIADDQAAQHFSSECVFHFKISYTRKGELKAETLLWLK